MKKLLATILTLILIISVFSALPVMAEENAEKVEITFKVGDSVLSINGKDVEVETPYVVGKGTTLVPLRVITEAFGAKVGWDDATKKITLEYPDVNIVLQIGNIEVIVNDHTETLLAAPELPKDTTMVPLRFISETFGATVTYDEATELITVTKELSNSTDSSLKGATSMERIGDSYYNWSIDTPTELFMEDRRFDGLETKFTDDAGNMLLIAVQPIQEDDKFDDYYNELKETAINETLIVSEKKADRYSNQYMHFRKKDAETLREIYVYFSKENLYFVNVAGDLKNDLTYLFDIAASFRIEFIPANTYNLSNVVENMREYKNEKYKFSLKIPADWRMLDDLAENLTAFVSMREETPNLISFGIYSKSSETTARSLISRDYSRNIKYQGSYTKSTPIKTTNVANNTGYEYTVTVSGTKNNDSYLHDIYFEKGSYIYNFTADLPYKDTRLISSILATLKVEELDKNEIGVIIKNDSEYSDEIRQIEHDNWTADMPQIWQQEKDENDLIVYKNSIADSFITISVSDSNRIDIGILRAAMDEQLAKMSKDFPDSKVIKSVYQKIFNKHPYYLFSIMIPNKDSVCLYYNYYATIKDGQLISVVHIANEETNGEILTAEVENIISSIAVKAD